MSLIIKTKKGTKKKAILGAPSKTQLSQKHQNLIKDLIEEQTKLILKEKLGVKRLIYLRRINYSIVYSIDERGEKIVSKFVYKNGKLPGLIHIDATLIEAAGIQISEFVDQMKSYGLKEAKKDARSLLEQV